jgi:hypothetical protein
LTIFPIFAARTRVEKALEAATSRSRRTLVAIKFAQRILNIFPHFFGGLLFSIVDKKSDFSSDFFRHCWINELPFVG